MFAGEGVDLRHLGQCEHGFAPVGGGVGAVDGVPLQVDGAKARDVGQLLHLRPAGQFVVVQLNTEVECGVKRIKQQENYICFRMENEKFT